MTPRHPQPLEDIQDAILERLHAGESVDRDALAAEHPEHAEALRRFFEVVDLMEAAPEALEAVPTRLGDFRIVREIGRGGMGVVYEAEQVSLKRKVALKILPPALRRDRRLLTRFQREAEAAGRLRHPNVVPVYSIGEAGGAPFFAMELVEGRSLAQIIGERRDGGDAGLPNDPQAYRRWAVQVIARVADALEYAHGQGILHRDAKPANILVEADGTPRLTDFGLALDLEATSLTVSGELFGSPQYMSPEQAFRREQPLDARTDIYSLGVTLYELLTLRLPYRGTTSHELLGALHEGKVVPPREADPEMPTALSSVLLRALRTEPSERYDTAGMFAADLRAVLEDRPVAARRPGRRRAVLLGSGALLVAVLTLVLSRQVILGGRARAELGNPARVIPTGDDVRLLVAGSHPDSEAAMRGWFQPTVSQRHIVARSSRASCRFWIPVPSPQNVPADTVVVAMCEVSVNRGPWQRMQSHPLVATLYGGSATESSYAVGDDLRALLGEALADNAVSLRQRVRLRVMPRPAGWTESAPEHDPDFDDLDVGTQQTWTWGPETLLIYDDYPADYPRAVSDPELDANMLAVYTPDAVGWRWMGSSGPADRSLALELLFEHPPALAVAPLAATVELLPAAGGPVIASATWADFRMPATLNPFAFTLLFHLPPEPTPEEAAFLLDLQAGNLETVRLVLRPARDVALEQPDFETYWAGHLDLLVPLHTEER